jgi:hypothetical protein
VRYETDGLQAVVEEINARHRETLFVRVAGPNNHTLLQHIPLEWNEFDFSVLAASRPDIDLQWTYLEAEEEDLFEDPDRMEILSSTLPDGSLVQVGRSTEARKDILDYFQNLFALVMIAVLAIGFAGGALLASRSLRPLRDLAGGRPAGLPLAAPAARPGRCAAFHPQDRQDGRARARPADG